MNLLYPLGLLGLIGIAILILIYLIKPNYQQKIISSTMVWKLSFKYRKRRIPINRLRNLIILICQILVITVGALILAHPYMPDALEIYSTERIFVLDASGTMLARQGGDDTRFTRAVSQMRDIGREVIDDGGRVSVIIANQQPSPVISRTGVFSVLDEALNGLTELNNLSLPKACTFGEANVDDAMKLADGILRQNPAAKIQFFTSTEYDNSSHVEVINVAKHDNNEEWNAAIVDCTATFSENIYRFAVDVASYNRDKDIDVKFDVYGLNGMHSDVPTSSKITAQCRDNVPVTIHFNNLGINSYSRIHIYIELASDDQDSFPYDNNFNLYDSQTEELTILYVTPSASNFFSAILPSLRFVLEKRWDIYFETTSLDEIIATNREIKGFDMYIFEYFAPDSLPTDGVVLLLGLVEEPKGIGIRYGEEVENLTLTDDECRLVGGEVSQIMANVNPQNIMVRKYHRVIVYDDFKVLMNFPNSLGNDPVLLLKNTPESKILLFSFATLYADLSLVLEFPAIFLNIINVMFPVTVNQRVYEVGEMVNFDQNSEQIAEINPTMTVMGAGTAGGYVQVFSNGNYEITHDLPGIYDLTQPMLPSTRISAQNYYVRVSKLVSDFTRTDSFKILDAPSNNFSDMDIYIYFAAALCALVFIERLLHVKEEF